jgi:glutaredoxin
VREFLSDHDVLFEDRNIRQSEEACAELAARSVDIVVPQLFWNDVHIVGFDPAALDQLVREYRTAAA